MPAKWVWPAINGADSNIYRVVFQNVMVAPSRPVRTPLELLQIICSKQREKGMKANCEYYLHFVEGLKMDTLIKSTLK